MTHAAPRKPGDPENHVDKALEIAQRLEGANDKASSISATSDFRPKSEANCPS